MRRRIIAELIMCCLIICLSGCFHTKTMVSSQALIDDPQLHQSKILVVITSDGEILEFKHGATFTGDKLEGYLKDNSYVTLEIEQAKLVYIQHADLSQSCIPLACIVSSVIGAFLFIYH